MLRVIDAETEEEKERSTGEEQDVELDDALFESAKARPAATCSII